MCVHVYIQKQKQSYYTLLHHITVDNIKVMVSRDTKRGQQHDMTNCGLKKKKERIHYT